MANSKSDDDKFIEKMEREQREMLYKYYGLRPGDLNWPAKPYLLEPDRLVLSSYERLNDRIIKLNIEYKTRWSGYISDTVRINYDQYIIGTIYCENVDHYREVSYKKKGTIDTTFFSSYKTLNLPIKNTNSLLIKCKKIIVGSINVFAEENGKLITEEEYLDKMRSHFGK
jgi:hypothetical protein